MFREHSGETCIAKEITHIDFQKGESSLYTGRDNKETFELSISGNKITVKEILSNCFSEYDYEKTVIVFVLCCYMLVAMVVVNKTQKQQKHLIHAQNGLKLCLMLQMIITVDVRAYAWIKHSITSFTGILSMDSK